MELKLQRFIQSITEIVSPTNLDPHNAVVVVLQHPQTSDDFYICVSHNEPDYLGIPLNCIWICINPVSIHYLKALKLKFWKTSAPVPQIIENEIPGFNQSWIEVRKYDEIFADAQSYGVQGPEGPAGPAGPKGPDGVVDYNAIVAQALTLIPLPQSLSIEGADSVLESTTSQYTATITYTNGSTAVITNSVTWGVQDALLGSIAANGVLTAFAVSANGTQTITASYTENGVTVSANKSVTILNNVPVSIAIAGPTTVNEGETAQYTATVTLISGATAQVAANWSLSNPVLGNIDANGLFTAAEVITDSTVDVTASYTVDGVTVQDTHTVTIVDVPLIIYPYYGVANMNAVKDEAFILALTGRGPNGNRTATFTLDSGAPGSGLKMYYAYPVSYGQATFIDTSNGFEGGWDGVRNDPFNLPGPIIVPVTVGGNVVDFYLYGTDFDGIGQVTWQVT